MYNVIKAATLNDETPQRLENETRFKKTSVLYKENVGFMRRQTFRF